MLTFMAISHEPLRFQIFVLLARLVGAGARDAARPISTGLGWGTGADRCVLVVEALGVVRAADRAPGVRQHGVKTNETIIIPNIMEGERQADENRGSGGKHAFNDDDLRSMTTTQEPYK